MTTATETVRNKDCTKAKERGTPSWAASVHLMIPNRANKGRLSMPRI